MAGQAHLRVSVVNRFPDSRKPLSILTWRVGEGTIRVSETGEIVRPPRIVAAPGDDSPTASGPEIS